MAERKQAREDVKNERDAAKSVKKGVEDRAKLKKEDEKSRPKSATELNAGKKVKPKHFNY